MTKYLNALLQELLRASPSATVPLEPEIREILASPIVEDGDCLVFAYANVGVRLDSRIAVRFWDHARGALRRRRRRRAPDLDGVDYEVFFNDIGFGFEIEDRANLAPQAVEAVDVVVENLRRSGFPGPVRVIATVDTWSEIPSVTVRFHRIREGMRNWIEVEEAERFETNGIMMVDLEPGI